MEWLVEIHLYFLTVLMSLLALFVQVLEMCVFSTVLFLTGLVTVLLVRTVLRVDHFFKFILTSLNFLSRSAAFGGVYNLLKVVLNSSVVIVTVLV